MLKFIQKDVVHLLFIIAIFIFRILMLNTIKQYFSFRTDVGFLLFKQQIVQNRYWRFFFYVHVFSILICLLAGISQFSDPILQQFPRIHKFIGKLYVYNILIINFPACLILALFSNGGTLGIIGFCVQDFLWIIYTIAAVVQIKKGKIKLHKKFMIYSYAITTTAITFRVIKNLLYNEKVFDYTLFYGINVWIALILNWLIAFLIVQLMRKSST